MVCVPGISSIPRTARERVRAELTGEIKAVARRHLAEVGSAGLSLRAVARDVGMVSSAVYRYFPSRDELLTALIIDAYNEFGIAVIDAEAAIARPSVRARWLTSCRAARAWAHAAPQQFALIFGSPVPGYAAPRDTIDPAGAVPVMLLRIITDAHNAGRLSPPAESAPRSVPRAVRADLKGLRVAAGVGLDDRTLARTMMAWTQLIGAISFELFGHLHNIVFADEAYFEHQMHVVADELGLD